MLQGLMGESANGSPFESGLLQGLRMALNIQTALG